MTRRLAQSTAYTVMLKLFLSSDHVTAATGKTVAITLSKAGGAFGNPNAGASNATEVSNGWYKFALDTTDTGTIGDLIVRGTAASCDDTEQVTQIVSAATGGATNLDAAISTRLATSGYTAPDNSTITAINAKTTNLPSDPADASDIATAFAAVPAAVWANGTRTLSAAVTVSGTVNANVVQVNSVTVNGAGTLVSPWGP